MNKTKKINQEIFKDTHPEEYKKNQEEKQKREEEEEEYKKLVQSRMVDLN